MAIVTLETPTLSSEAKKRLGDRILHALQLEGIAPATTVMMFRTVTDDLYMDGLLVEAEPVRSTPALAAPVFTLAAAPAPVAAPAPEAPAAKGGRKKKSEVEASRDLLRALLTERRSVNSFEAQKAFEKANLDCTPTLLRRLFQEMESQGLVTRTGMKRGTRYVLRVPEGEGSAPGIKLVKAEMGQ